jgi:FAD-dependent urate hydroxylase
MRAVIIGGGMGGPVAAMALQGAGWETVVHEVHASPAPFRGLFMGLGINGMRVLRDLNALNPVMRANTVPTPRMVLSSATGKQLGVVSNGRLDAATPSVTIMRGALQQALGDEARSRGIELRYGKRFIGYGESGRGVVARFDDGSEVAGDVLIGADGLRSRVRALMTPDALQPSFTGLLSLGGVSAGVGLPATPDTMHMVWGRRAFFGYTVRSNGETWWFANLGMEREPDRDEISGVATGEWKTRLGELFAEDLPFIRELIEATDQIGATPIHDLPSLPTWHRGRVVLLGDAAHAVSPSAGQGASMAMEDAVVLAKCLRDMSVPQRALARYEELRRPRAEGIVATGRMRGKYKAPKSRAALFLRDLLMPLALRVFATEKSMSWIFDYHIPWDEPIRASTRLS